jgi:hypothetical protein
MIAIMWQAPIGASTSVSSRVRRNRSQGTTSLIRTGDQSGRESLAELV